MKQFTYSEALAYIHGMYGLGEKRGLDNMHALMKELGNPHQKIRAIHVAGTNGKGSVCAFTQAILRCAGYSVGLYTSPFLQRYNERIRLNGKPIADDELAEITSLVAEAVLQVEQEGVKPTEFEIGTAVAFVYFAKQKVDFAVIEVGLGGRIDPTNILWPEVSAIAAIGFDHTKVLGDTLELIAAEKAGIAKTGVPMVVSGQNDEAVLSVIRNRCEEVKVTFSITKPTDGIVLGLQGEHQAYNAGLAVGIVEQLQKLGVCITDEAIADGLSRVRWPGRLEWVSENPAFILDGAHNLQGAEALASYLKALPALRIVLITGMLRDKDWEAIAAVLAKAVDEVITVKPDSHRALEAGILAQVFERHGKPVCAAASLQDALVQAHSIAGQQGVIVIAGSLYLVGEARTVLGCPDNTLLAE